MGIVRLVGMEHLQYIGLIDHSVANAGAPWLIAFGRRLSFARRRGRFLGTRRISAEACESQHGEGHRPAEPGSHARHGCHGASPWIALFARPPDDTAKSHVARRGVDRLRVTRRRSVAAAIVRRTQVRAALEHLARNPDARLAAVVAVVFTPA